MKSFCFALAAFAVFLFAGFGEANPVVRGRGIGHSHNLNLGLGYANMLFGAGAMQGCGVPAQGLFAPQMAYQDCNQGVVQQQQFAPAYGMGAAFAPQMQYAPAYGVGAGFAPMYGVGNVGVFRQRGVVIRQRGVIVRNRGLFSRQRAVIRVRGRR